MHICLQNLVSIQPGTSPPKIAKICRILLIPPGRGGRKASLEVLEGAVSEERQAELRERAAVDPVHTAGRALPPVADFQAPL